jgi:hypothetical protein
MMLARVPMSTTRPVAMVSLGLLVFVLGVLHAPPTIRPTLEALNFVLDSGLNNTVIDKRVKAMVWRLERLLTAAMLVGGFVAFVCIGALFVPGAQAIAPYVYIARILFPLFVATFELVLPKQQRGGNRVSAQSAHS